MGGHLPLQAVERWEAPDDGEAIESCTILTTEAVELPQPIHDRMPVILTQRTMICGLIQRCRSLSNYSSYCVLTALRMIAYPVSTQVNKPNNNSLSVSLSWKDFHYRG